MCGSFSQVSVSDHLIPFVGNKSPDSGRELAAYYAIESWGQQSEPGLWSHRYPMRQTLFNIQS